MTSLGLWTAAPAFDVEEEKAEKAKIPFRDMAAAVLDVNGGGPAQRQRQGPEMAGNHGGGELEQDANDDAIILRLDAAINALDENLTGAWRRAHIECPDQVGRDHKLLFIRSEDRTRTIVDVAKKICKHWELRLQLFGPTKAFLPMTLGGAARDDWVGLTNANFLKYLPNVEDQFGRAVLYCVSCKNFRAHEHDRKSVLRACWYVCWAASQEMRHPSQGAILLINLARVELPNMDRKLILKFYELTEVFPFVFRAQHIFHLPWFYKLLNPLVQYCMTPHWRTRKVVYTESTVREVVRGLHLHGIRKSELPVEAGGDLEFDFEEWLKNRKINGL